jgi:hypothetical protein
VTRDFVFEELKLPFIYSQVTNSLSESAQKAFEALKRKYEKDVHVEKIVQSGMIANSTYNHCGLGVYVMKLTGNTSSCWEVHSKSHCSFVPAGTLMRFEPFVFELETAETSVYASPINEGKMSLLYKVETSFGARGVSLEKGAMAVQNESSGRAEKELIRNAYILFSTKLPQWKTAAIHLTLRFDFFHCSNKVYLNEVDVVPLAFLFLDDYFGTKLHLLKLSDTMARYIKNHWGSWPA